MFLFCIIVCHLIKPFNINVMFVDGNFIFVFQYIDNEMSALSFLTFYLKSHGHPIKEIDSCPNSGLMLNYFHIFLLLLHSSYSYEYIP